MCPACSREEFDDYEEKPFFTVDGINVNAPTETNITTQTGEGRTVHEDVEASAKVPIF